MKVKETKNGNNITNPLSVFRQKWKNSICASEVQQFRVSKSERRIFLW